MLVRSDCLHFNGYKPCRPHKQAGLHCESCEEYRPSTGNILIIKLQAAGEVVRNTPILRKIKLEHPNHKIFWLTKFPELIPEKWVDRVIPFTAELLPLLLDIEFDLLFSLDKDLEACALANQIKSKIKKGFSQKNGVVIPFNESAKRKWETGIFDDLMKKNTKHYVEEIFEICDLKYSGEEYILPEHEIPHVSFKTTLPKVGLNTGVGEMWRPRKYGRWQELSEQLQKNNYEVVLLGGAREDVENKAIADRTGATYFGVQPLRHFMGLMSLCDTVVTSVTMGLHLAIGLKKKVILLNNTFNKNEFHLYGRGITLEPGLSCQMCYKQDFDSHCQVQHCMDLVKPENVVIEIERLRRVLSTQK